MDAQLATLATAITSVIFMMAPSSQKEPKPSPALEKMQAIQKLTQDVAKHLGVEENERSASFSPDTNQEKRK